MVHARNLRVKTTDDKPASDEEEPRSLALGLMAIAVIIVVWTTFLLLSRHGAKGVLTPWDLAALRFGVSGVIMLPVIWWRGLPRLGLRQALTLALSAGLGFAVLAYAGFSYAPAAHGAILMPGVLPLATALIGFWLLREPIPKQRLVALGLILTGVAIMAWNSLSIDNHAVLFGDFLFLCATTCWATYTVLVRRWRLAPFDVVAVVAPITMLLFLPVYLLFLPSQIAQAPLQEVMIQGAFQGVGAVIIVLLAFTLAVKHLGPQVTTMLTAIVPGLASLLAVPLLEEPLDLAVLIGLIVVTAGMIATVAGFGRR